MSFPTKPWRRRWADNFVTGLFLLAPAYVTFLLVRFIVAQIIRVFDPIVRLIDPLLTTWWAVALVHLGALVAFAVGVALIGWGAKILVFRRLFGVAEQFIARVPMVGKIYSAVRDMAKAFTGERKTAFSRVVLVEWPGKGRYVIGFVTHEGEGEVQAKTPEHVVNVLVPTTPNPTTGFLILVDRESVIPLEMSVEDGMKLVISGGVVGPPVPRPERLEHP